MANSSLKEIATLFLKLGCIGFGGPAAHIAMMKDEVVNRRKWMTEADFLDLIGITNLLPGPNSTELAIHIGREKGGWKGLLVAGCCFIFPAVLITALLAFLYVQYGQLPAVEPFLAGIKPAIIPVIIAAVFPLAKQGGKSYLIIAIGILAFVLSLLGFQEVLIIFGAGLLALLLSTLKASYFNFSPFSLVFLQAGSGRWLNESLSYLFLEFLKIGSILYGSGYVLFAYIDTSFVSKGLLSRNQLLDAISVGQFTPGPVFSSVTFVGYVLEGWEGAVVATLAIFLPSFVFVALTGQLVKRLRKSARMTLFLDGVNIASVAVIAAVCVEFGKDVLVDWRSIVIALVAGLVVFRYKKLNSAYVVAGGALLGFLLKVVVVG